MRQDGLIPARAGKTHGHRPRPYGTEAHPRAGGENASELIDGLTPIGSSPRGRGKLLGGGPGSRGCRLIPARAGKLAYELYSYATKGLIPARAGKTDTMTDAHAWFGAHPRAGGENR